MKNKVDETHYNFKGLFNYISTVISWTIFVLLMLIGVLLIYYYVFLQLYKTKGEKFEPFFSIYTIVSPSMEPNINTLDAVINLKINDADDVQVNDVITFISTWKIKYGMTVTHRVVGTQILDDGSTCFITRGDNNPGNDEGCVKESNIIGVVKAVIPGLGKLQQFLSSGFGWILVVVIPALYILIKDIIKIIRMMNTSKEETKEKNVKKDTKKESIEKKPQKEEPKINKAESERKKLEEAYKDLKKVKNKK